MNGVDRKISYTLINLMRTMWKQNNLAKLIDVEELISHSIKENIIFSFIILDGKGRKLRKGPKTEENFHRYLIIQLLIDDNIRLFFY